MKTWEITGSLACAVAPSVALSVGTARQPSVVSPSERTISSTVSTHEIRSASARGRKTMPTPYDLLGGSVMPSKPHSRLRNS